MSGSRRQKIEEMLKDDPQDVTLQYMLAMEWDSENDIEKSIALYQKLMSLQPPHIDSYFRFAQQKVRLGEIAPARDALRDGIRYAREQDRNHTAAEMSDLLQSLGELGDS